MAILRRPGVEISQELTPSPSSAITTALVPVVVGPCFQIVEPLNSDGTKNTSAEVKIPAMIKSSATLDTLVAVAEKYFAIEVGTSSIVTFQFPATTDPDGRLNLELIRQILDQEIAGVKVSLVGEDSNILVISTLSTSAGSARLKLLSAETLIENDVQGPTEGWDNVEMAFSDLELTDSVDLEFIGQSSYSNKEFTIPFSNIPTPSGKAKADDLTFYEDKIELIKFFGSKASALSKTSSVSRTVENGSATSLEGNAISNIMYPLNLVPMPLYGLKNIGSKTSRLFSVGKHASVVCPLAHTSGDATVKWPDVTGLNYLKVEAVGFQNFIVDQNNAVGPYIGTSGNGKTVTFIDGLSEAVNIVDGDISIRFIKNTTTFATLADMLANASSNFIFTLAYEDGTALIDSGDSLDGLVFTLGGGIDPINFKTDSVLPAKVVGTVKFTNDAVASCAGKTISISVNGKVPVSETITLGSYTTVNMLAFLNTFPGITASQVTLYEKNGSTGADSFAALLLETEETDNLDSVISLDGTDSSVIEALFSGFYSATDIVTGHSSTVIDIASGTDFNTLASTTMQTALVPGELSIVVNTAVVKGFVGSPTTNAAAWDINNDSATLVIAHSELNYTSLGGPKSLTLDLDQTFADIDAVVAYLNDVFEDVNNDDDDDVLISDKIEAVALDTTSSAKVVAIVNKSTTGWMKLVTFGTTAAVKALIAGSGATLLTGAFDTEIVAKTASITIEDNISSIDTSINVSFPTVSTVSYLDKAETNLISHSEGAVEINLNASLITIASSTLSVTYTRVHASALDGTKYTYLGKVFSGPSRKVIPGDKLFVNKNIVGSIVKIVDFSVGGTTKTGAVLVLSNESFTPNQVINKWYITAENLTSSSTRVLPEVIVDVLNSEIRVKHSLNRGDNGVPVAGSASVLIEYSALRKDVSSANANPRLLVFNSLTEVEDLIGPISMSNPLALACYAAFLNSTTASITAIGVDEITANEPEGSVAAYVRAAEFLETVEVYAIAPLTNNSGVHQIFSNHVQSMSLPENKKERIVFINDLQPTEKVSELILSGEADIEQLDNTGRWSITFDETVNVSDALSGKVDANGDEISSDIGSVLTVENGVYLKRAGDPFKYLVTSITDANVVVIDSSPVFGPEGGPGTDGNSDGYYHTSDPEDVSPAGEDCSIFIRSVAIPTTTSAGKLEQCETLAEIAGGVSGYRTRRVYYVQPDKVGLPIAGIETLIPGYYACAGQAAMVGDRAPKQPHTNLPMAGFTRVVGSNDKFTEKMLDTAAAGGVFWLIQDKQGAPVICRHQLSTDVSSIKSQELTTTKALDYLAKIVRAILSPFIGREIIDKKLLSRLGLILMSNLRATEGYAVAGVKVGAIKQLVDAPDSIAIEVQADIYYPANRIKVTIVA